MLPRLASGTGRPLEALYEVYELIAAARRSIRLHAHDSIPLYEKTIKFKEDALPLSNEPGSNHLSDLCLHTDGTTLLRIAEWK
jgi:hypothetical protein